MRIRNRDLAQRPVAALLAVLACFPLVEVPAVAQEVIELGADEPDSLREAAVVLRILSREDAQSFPSSADAVLDVIDEALYRLDVIPAGLALGQAAYESGYGTSRFAVEGNALFGQWTFAGDGLVPERQRKELGDHRIASYDWPFDSVRGYFLNLNAHPESSRA